MRHQWPAPLWLWNPADAFPQNLLQRVLCRFVVLATPVAPFVGQDIINMQGRASILDSPDSQTQLTE